MKDEELLKTYFENNKSHWDNKTKIHIDSEFYDNESFLKGRNSLNDIELEYLKDIKGKKVLHIQCHFGQDSISMARMGAEVTATDISTEALKAARKFNKQCGTDVTFIETDTYNILNAVEGEFDLVFMTYGVAVWLPDIQKLADIVCKKLKKGGKVLCVEFHPMFFTFNFNNQKIEYGYNNVHVYEEEIENTYASNEEITGKEYFWQHSLEEMSMPYINNGMKMSAMREYYYSPYKIDPSMKTIGKNQYRFGDFKYPIPHVYLLEFTAI